MLTTPRLILLPATADLLQADINGPRILERALMRLFPGLRVPPDWPTEHYDIQAALWMLDQVQSSDEPDWWMYYFILKDLEGGQPQLIGNGGYKGPPDADGMVEIGYAIVSAHQRRGLATEAALALIENAWLDPRVRSLTAETLVGHTASIGVMEKCGLRFDGPTAEAGVIRYRLDR